MYRAVKSWDQVHQVHGISWSWFPARRRLHNGQSLSATPWIPLLCVPWKTPWPCRPYWRRSSRPWPRPAPPSSTSKRSPPASPRPRTCPAYDRERPGSLAWSSPSDCRLWPPCANLRTPRKECCPSCFYSPPCLRQSARWVCSCRQCCQTPSRGRGWGPACTESQLPCIYPKINKKVNKNIYTFGSRLTFWRRRLKFFHGAAILSHFLHRNICSMIKQPEDVSHYLFKIGRCQIVFGFCHIGVILAQLWLVDLQRTLIVTFYLLVLSLKIMLIALSFTSLTTVQVFHIIALEGENEIIQVSPLSKFCFYW